MPLYDVQNPYDKAMRGIEGASSTFARMDKAEKSKAESESVIDKTAGGALMAGGGGALLGAEVGSAIAKGGSTAGWWGAGIGAAIGLLSYFLS